MECFEYLMDRIDAELDDAKGYARTALSYKDHYKMLSDALYQLAQQELSHAILLKDHAMKIANSEHNEQWKYVYEWYKSRIIKREEHIRHLIEMYRM